MDLVYQVLLISLNAIICHGLYFVLRFLILPGRVKELPSNLPGHGAAVVAEKVVGLYASTICAIAGCVIFWENFNDVINSKSIYLYPTACFLYWYFVHDIFAMYETFRLSRSGAKCTTIQRTIFKFISHKKLFIFHHLVCVIFFLPFARGKMTNDTGDGLIGILFISELSTPFIAIYFILEHSSYKDTIIQHIDGVIFIFVFFVCRILAVPFVYLFYANQHHQGDILSAAHKLRWYCHFAALSFLLLQSVWFCAAFSKLMRGARRLFDKKVN